MFYGCHQIHKKKLTHNKSCRDVCAPMILYQAYTNSSKLDLKNTTKLQQIKEVVVVVLFRDSRFIQMGSLQEAVELSD